MSAKPHIALVTNSTWTVYNFCLHFIKRFRLAGYRVTVIAPVDEYIQYLQDSYFVKHVPLRYLKHHGTNPLMDVLLIRELYGIYRREKPDLVLHFGIKPNIYGSLAARLSRVSVISTVMGLGYTFLHPRFFKRIVWPLYRLAFRQNKAVVFLNRADLELFVAERLLREGQAVLISGTGVNTNYFRPLPRPLSDRFVFIYLGRLLYDKGVAEYVQAARKLRALSSRIECWIVGDFSYANQAAVSREELLEWVAEKSVRYLGSARDVRPYLKRADALVLPSYREGLSRVITEAMSMEKPVVTTQVPGCEDAVEEGVNGFLAKAGDVESLAEAMYRMYLLSEEERRAMGRRNRKKVLERFDEKVVFEQYLALVQRRGRILGQVSNVQKIVPHAKVSSCPGLRSLSNDAQS